MDSYNTTVDFNPYNQTITVLAPDGLTPIPFQVSDMTSFQTLTVQTAIIDAVQVGLSGMLMLVVLLVTKPDKRKNPVFLINMLTLFIICLKNIIACAVLTGPIWNFYNAWLGWWPASAWTSFRVNASVEVLGFLTTALIEGSMSFQMYTICCAASRARKRVILAATISVAIVATALRFTLAVINIDKDILSSDIQAHWIAILNKVEAASVIAFVCSTFLFSVCFVVVLWSAIHQRRQLGLQQFGPLQIIFIMGCQTMIVPTIFGILVFAVLRYTQINAFAITVTAMFLPLCSMWAAAHAANTHDASASAAPGLVMRAAQPKAPGALANPFSAANPSDDSSRSDVKETASSTVAPAGSAGGALERSRRPPPRGWEMLSNDSIFAPV